LGTYSGRKFYIKSVREEDIDIRDIAHSLSLQCRFAGHIKNLLSVAAHSINCARYVERQYKDNQLALCALLHDASEAYLVDIPRPLKYLVSMDGYRELEEKVQRAILKKYGLSYPMPPEIKTVDDLMVATEAHYLLKNADWAKDLIRLDHPPNFIGANFRRVEKEFLRIFRRLINAR